MMLLSVLFPLLLSTAVESNRGSYGFLKKQGYFEGDIRVDRYTRVLVKGRVSVIDRPFVWDYGRVPYAIDRTFDKYPHERQLISQAMSTIAKQSCVRFVPRTTETYYVRFIRGYGCYSYVGKSSIKAQPISIGVGCSFLGVVLHEIMHALGFFHTSSRPDRDSYVDIFYNNIQPGHKYDFNKYTNRQVSRQGVPYDLKSLMHLPRTYFSKNNRHTIESRLSPNVPLGQLKGLSPIDIQEINTLYKCPTHKGCYHSLGMQDCRIRDSWISASSYKSYYYQPHQARLHLTASSKGAGVWCTSRSSSGQYVMIDLGKVKRVSGITTEGMLGIFDPDAWVTAYTIRYSMYRNYLWRNINQNFKGNWDGVSAEYNAFTHIITARYVMIVPLQWHQAICMRLELYGCDV